MCQKKRKIKKAKGRQGGHILRNVTKQSHPNGVWHGDHTLECVWWVKEVKKEYIHTSFVLLLLLLIIMKFIDYIVIFIIAMRLFLSNGNYVNKMNSASDNIFSNYKTEYFI